MVPGDQPYLQKRHGHVAICTWIKMIYISLAPAILAPCALDASICCSSGSHLKEEIALGGLSTSQYRLACCCMAAECMGFAAERSVLRSVGGNQQLH